MKKMTHASLTCFLFLTSANLVPAMGANSTDWALKGTWTDGCCCKIPCPCFFGTKATEGHCEGASLIEIKAGHYGKVNLDGMKAITAYRVKKWSKIYVSDNASKEQVKAIGDLLQKAIPFLAKSPLKGIEAGPLKIVKDGDSISYSSPETSVTMAPVLGSNGKPIVFQNLPAEGTPFPTAHDHTQYRATKLAHKSAGKKFEWKGRNAFSAKLNIASTD